MMYVVLVEKPISIQEIEESSIASLEAEEIKSIVIPNGESNDRIVYTCQIPYTFGIVKCSTESAEGSFETSLPELHVIIRSARPFQFLKRLDVFPRVPFWFQLFKSYEDAWAIAPYSQQEPLSQVPLLRNPKNSVETDSEECESEYGFYDSDSDYLLNERNEYDFHKQEA